MFSSLTPFPGGEAQPLPPGLRRIALEVSVELYARMEARAAARREGVEAWALRAVIRALQQPEFAIDRCACAARPAEPAQAERSVAHHAAHP